MEAVLPIRIHKLGLRDWPSPGAAGPARFFGELFAIAQTSWRPAAIAATLDKPEGILLWTKADALLTVNSTDEPWI
jgi:hypothetical protein